MSRYARRISPGLRRQIFSVSGDHCQRCGADITWETFHVAHLRAASHGGPPLPENLEAWCAPCNLTNGAHDVKDTRLPLRAWQQDALLIVLTALTEERVATLMAAPGAGKTLFSAVTFAHGQEAGLWQRLLVVVPRLPLVEQWATSVLRDYHIALDSHEGARQSGRELAKMDGVVTTYQSLLQARVLEGHRAATTVPTLVILDEVHHLGQPVRDESGDPAWSKAVRELLGDLRTQLTVAGVLNLSGTLFRTSPAERIATVRYIEVEGAHGEPRIQAVANYEIHPERLVREGLLRAPDLYRVGATVEIVNLKTANVTVGSIADLNDDAAIRTALRRLNLKPEWVSQLVAVTLDQLERRYRDSGRAPVKALIVTHRQDMARAFAQEVDRQMGARGLQPLAECVVSDDGPDAYRRLDDFRQKKRVGVLCCVGMAGEGYDAPDIAVVTYATNVQTAQYIRQVVARGQRVTSWERDNIGHALTTAIILPDIPELVEQFRQILAPMVHEVEVGKETSGGGGGGGNCGGDGERPFGMEVNSVRDAALDIVTAVGTEGSSDVDPALQDLLAPILREVNLPESLWPRIAEVMNKVNQQRPFERPVTFGVAAVVERPGVESRPMTAREQHEVIRKQLTLASRWWAAQVSGKGGQRVDYFLRDVYDTAGIKKLDDALPEQLQRALMSAHTRIRRHCEETGTALPSWLRV